MRSLFSTCIIFLITFFPSQAQLSNSSSSIDGHPAWIEQGNIYEVNVRQYTPEGTFRAFSKHLPRLKEMGVQTLWFMPVNPISKKDRKGALGSYYAVSDYTAINPEFGNMADWKELVRKAHQMGFKVIIDWVPNHSGADNRWLIAHPDFYVKDKNGNALSPYDWTDVRKLNYDNRQLRDSMIAAMKFWIKTTDIDGFRCDVAGDVPKDFWINCIGQLHKMKNIFMLAESNAAWLHEAGFDATYTWDAFNMMKMIAHGDRPAFGLDSILQKVNGTYTKNALRMYFTSNHDENSWNKADFGTMPGHSQAPFAVLTQTMERSVPLIYSGQEEPVLDSISFFFKDTIPFSNFERANFYKVLLSLRKNNPALAANAAFKRIHTSNDAAIYAFEREKKGRKVLVILNLTNTTQRFSWNDHLSASPWTNVFAKQKESIYDKYKFLPWEYRVLETR
jgi:alpha-amylase